MRNMQKAAVTMRKFSEKEKENFDEQPEESLGDTLRNARLRAGLELADIHRQTKISLNNLKAMEDGRYGDMPAPSFCRGFYKIYAQAVGLNPEKMADNFSQEWQRLPKRKQTTSFFSFDRRDEEIDAMAGRPSLMAFSSIGLFLLLLTFFTAFLCWFFSWNPASFLSQKLRSFDHSPTLEERFSPTGGRTEQMVSFDNLGNWDSRLPPLAPLVIQKGYSSTDYQNAAALLAPYSQAKPFDFLIAASANTYPQGYLSENFAQYLTFSIHR